MAVAPEPEGDAATGPVPPGDAPARYTDIARQLIGGVWREGGSGRLAPDRDPFSGETLAEISLASLRDVDDAYRTAERAQKGWAAVRPQNRRTLMERAAHILQARRAEIVDWLISESGSTYAKAMFEWDLVYQDMLESAAFPFHVTGRLLPSAVRDKDSHVYRTPAGVVGIVSPWSFPLYLSSRSVTPAIAVGNAVVLKPASDTPVTGGLLLARIFEEAGLPPEVLSVICGAGGDIGDAFVDHPIPRVISFTGSTEVGRRIGEHAGRNIKRVCLELGGNCPFIVLDDADLAHAVDAAIAGKYLHQGQICIAINRILVDARVHDEFRDRFVARAAALRVGDPKNVDTDIGPLINRDQVEKVERLLEDTIRAGARVLLRGQTSGNVMPPVVLDHVTNEMPAAAHELCGPVAPIIRFQDDEQAIRLANDTEHGLSSAVFTRDVERGMRVAKRLQAGMTHINDWTVNVDANTAFGGEKASGIGRFGGEWAIEEFTTSHWISVQEKPRAYPL
jgi:aldehyde dehydrogenase (NAD+)